MTFTCDSKGIIMTKLLNGPVRKSTAATILTIEPEKVGEKVGRTKTIAPTSTWKNASTNTIPSESFIMARVRTSRTEAAVPPNSCEHVVALEAVDPQFLKAFQQSVQRGEQVVLTV